MKRAAVLYIEENLSDEDLTFAGKFLPEELKSRLSSIDNIDEVYASVPADYSGKAADVLSTFKRTEKDDITFWKRFFKESDADHAVMVLCDSPFLDPGIIRDMLDVHIDSLAEFTYSENLPRGYCCEIISGELMESVPDSGEKMLPLGSVIRTNINQFDVELFYRAPDIRDKRLSFRCGDSREKRIMENIRDIHGKEPLYSEIQDIINSNPGVLYVSPSWVEIELTGKCDLDCIFCYRKTLRGTHRDMDAATFKKILGDMRSFGLPYSICLGGSGEPMMHERFYEIMDMALDDDLLKMIVIETNGIYADSNFKNYIESANDSRVRIIFNINGMDKDTYFSIHGGDYFDTVLQNIISLKEIMPEDDSLYIQIMKINETEGFLDAYYNFWEKYKIPIILQKQNTFLSRIEDRRYSDLSPLERTPCWHLQRDLYILSDGRAAFCKQDVDGDYAVGSVLSESIYEIWKKGESAFLDNYTEKFPAGPDCRSCDEWYTFNL